jgi:diketogulonate reductase-like aldo/keto reductase
MVRRAFGWTGVEMPVIGQGTWNLEGGREKERRAVAALRAGLDLGMTHIDTAEMYGSGRAEELVAEAIAGRRNEVFLVSKVLPSNASYKGTLAACERSLARLKTDRLDLYLLHWRGGYRLEETMRAMEALVAEGKIRFFGVSNFDVADVREAQAALTGGRLACNQVLYHLHDRGIERKLIPYCRNNGIAVVAYSPFGHGDFPDAAVLGQIGKHHGRTARQAALNFLTRDPGVFTIPKAGGVEHVRDNSGGAGWDLTAGDLAQIDAAFPAPDHDVPLGML